MQMMLGCRVFGVVGQCRVRPFAQVHDGRRNKFALAVLLECLTPGGVGVHVVEDHDAAVAKAGDRGNGQFGLCTVCALNQ
jgi:hypothetical protein